LYSPHKRDLRNFYSKIFPKAINLTRKAIKDIKNNDEKGKK